MNLLDQCEKQMKIDPSLIRNCPEHGAHTGKVCPRCNIRQTISTPVFGVIGMKIIITGQIMGGKNNIVITRTGHRFPKPSWSKWRDDAVQGVREQTPRGWVPIDSPVNVRLDYFAGDKRRRDMPAIIDRGRVVSEVEGEGCGANGCWCRMTQAGYREEDQSRDQAAHA